MDVPTLSDNLIIARRIKILSFAIDETNIPEDIIFKVDFNQQFSFNFKQNLVFTVLKVWYSIPQDENNIRIVLECQVQNIFELSNMQDYLYTDGKVLFPNDVLINITSLSITHARAVIAIQTAGTVFGDTLIPVVNPVEATIAFFKTTSDEDAIQRSREKVDIKDIALAPTDKAKKQTKKAVK